MSRFSSSVPIQNVQGKAPPLRKLTALKKAFPAACYPLLCAAVAESRRRGLSLEDTLSDFARQWKSLKLQNPPDAPTSAAECPRWLPDSSHGPRGEKESGETKEPQLARRWCRKHLQTQDVAFSDGIVATDSLVPLNHSQPELLRNGMAVFRNVLPKSIQQWLVDLFFAIGDSDKRSGFGCYHRLSGGKMVLNYGHRAQYVDEIAQFPSTLQSLQASIRQLVETSEICGRAPASVAIINYYGSFSNGMGWHVDADTDPPHVTAEEAQESAVVSLSIGDACDFCYRDQQRYGKGRGKGKLKGQGKAKPALEERLRLNSGDVLVFGGPSRSVEHCVDGLYGAESRPAWLQMPPGRLNITFRYW